MLNMTSIKDHSNPISARAAAARLQLPQHHSDALNAVLSRQHQQPLSRRQSENTISQRVVKKQSSASVSSVSSVHSESHAPTVHSTAHPNCSLRFQHLHHLLHKQLSPTMTNLKQFYSNFLNPIIGDPALYGVKHSDDLYMLCTRIKNIILSLVNLWRKLCDALVQQSELEGSYSGSDKKHAGEVSIVRVLRRELNSECWEGMEMYLRRFSRMMRQIGWIVEHAHESTSDSDEWVGWCKLWEKVESMPFCAGLGLTAMYMLPLRAWLQLEEGWTRIWNAMPSKHKDNAALEQFLGKMNTMMQPLRSEIVWQKRMRFLDIQESIQRSNIKGGGIVFNSESTLSDISMLGGEKKHLVPVLLTPTRDFLDEGYMYKVHKSTGGASSFVKVLLFSDCFVYASDTHYDHQGNYHGSKAPVERRQSDGKLVRRSSVSSNHGAMFVDLPVSTLATELFYIRRVIPLLDCWITSVPSNPGGFYPNLSPTDETPTPDIPASPMANITFHLIQVLLDADVKVPLDKTIFLCRTEEEKYEWTQRLRETIESLPAQYPQLLEHRKELLENSRLILDAINGDGNQKSKAGLGGWIKSKFQGGHKSVSLDLSRVNPDEAEMGLSLVNTGR